MCILQVEIIGSGISNISNNGKRYVIPLALRNDVDDPLMWRNTDLPWEKGCMKEGNVFFYPYECSIKISPEGSIHDIESILKVYPNFDFKSGEYFISSLHLKELQYYLMGCSHWVHSEGVIVRST